MAHIILRDGPDGPPTKQLIINGHDFSMETYGGTAHLVEVGEGDFAEVGLQVTFVVSRLDLEGDEDVVVTDHLASVAQRVRSIQREST